MNTNLEANYKNKQEKEYMWFELGSINSCIKHYLLMLFNYKMFRNTIEHQFPSLINKRYSNFFRLNIVHVITFHEEYQLNEELLLSGQITTLNWKKKWKERKKKERGKTLVFISAVKIKVVNWRPCKCVVYNFYIKNSAPP